MRIIMVILCLLVCLAAGASARSWQVPADAATLQEGLDLAAPTDTLVLAPGVYHVYDFQVRRGLVLRGETGLPGDVILDAEMKCRLLTAVGVADTLVIEGITLRNGLATGAGDAARGGAIFLESTPARFRNCHFVDNVATGGGGALYIDECSQVELIDCELVGNSAHAPGVAAPGGAIAMFVHASEGSLIATRCKLDGNLSGGPGGAIFIDDGNLFLTDTEVTNSRSGQESWSAGAGIFLRRAHASLSGPEAPDLLIRIDGCRIAGNVGRVVAAPYAGDGGGVLIKGYDAGNLFDVLVTDTVFEDNFNAQGGGLYVGRYAEGLVSRCSFRYNRAYLTGGGSVKGGRFLASLGETARFEYCEFLGNEAGYDETGAVSPELGWGGAFYARYYPRAEFINCSFSGNRSGGTLPTGDAIYHNSEGRTFINPLQKCVIVNSVFYGGNGLDVQVRGEPGGFESVTNSAYASGEYVCDGVIPTDLVDLTESPYRGPADLRLREASPCIDQALAVGISPDLAGTEVPVGNDTDIGAYESTAISAVDGGAIPGAVRRLTAAPNPFNPRTIISFDLALAGRVHLDCYDLAGRRVRSLLSDDLPAGPHRIAWDGRDDGGRPLASAVYLIRLTTPARREAGRVLLLK